MKHLRFLGASGSKSYKGDTISILLDDTSVIDAGNILKPLGERAKEIENIFLTHSHMDHIHELPFLIENFFTSREKPLNIYGNGATITAIKKYIFNWDTWPDFSAINMLNSKKMSMNFIEFDPGVKLDFESFSIEATRSNHTVLCNGYIVDNGESSIYISGDTYKEKNIWHRLNSDQRIKSAVFDVSFFSSLEQLAIDSRHLTPKLLKEEVDEFLERIDLKLYFYHLKLHQEEIIKKELEEFGLLKFGGAVLKDGDIVEF